MVGLAVLVLSILYLVGINIGTALAICSIVYVILNTIVETYRKRNE